MPGALATAQRRGGRFVVTDAKQATRLHGKAAVGSPRAGNALDLDPIEAAWCVAEGKLEVAGLEASTTLAAIVAEGGGRAEVGLLAYADLRARGYAVRVLPAQPGLRFEVLPRGKSAGPAQHALHIRSERDAVEPEALAAWAEEGALVGLVDEDGAVTYYSAQPETPEGQVPVGRLPPSQGTPLRDRVLVEDPVAAQAYHDREFLGTRFGTGLLLSFTEAEALRRRGVLAVPSGFAQAAAAAQTHFRRTLPAYEALRARGVVCKSGFRFGTHLRGYAGDPGEGHAHWLVHCLGGDEHWSDLSRGVRLAHGVRKRFVAATAWAGAEDGGRGGGSGRGQGGGPGAAVAFTHLSWVKL